MRRRWAAVLGAAVLAGTLAAVVPDLVAAANPPEPPPAGAIVVGTAGASCPSPSYATIQSAIDAASPGATIYVCAGTYDESPTIDKPLVLDGAQYDVDATSRGGSTETVIDGSGGITYTAGATSGTVDGFTLEGYTGSAAEIDAVGVGSDWRWIDDVIDVSGGGIAFDTDGAANPVKTTINRDLFVQATPSAATSGDAGEAVIFTGGTANDVNVAYDAFSDLSGPGAAVVSTGDGACGTALDTTDFSSSVVIAGNTFTEDGASFTDPVNGPGFDDEPFLDLVCTNAAEVSGNTVTITDDGDAHAQTPIDLAGGDWSTDVGGNTLTGNGAPDAAGVELDSDSYPPGTGIGVTSNQISGFADGIEVRSGAGSPGNPAPTGFALSRNVITASTADGIAVEDGGGGDVLQNAVTGSATDDCLDATTGSETAGTADQWEGDGGTTSSPAGLCHSFVAPSLSLPSSVTAEAGSSFNMSLSASGYPLPTVAKLGQLPRGLHFTGGAGTATIWGTPSPRAAGAHTVTVSASSVARQTANRVTGRLTIQIDAPPTIASPASARVVPGQTFSVAIRARGYPVPTLSESGALPSGVTFSAPAAGTAVLAGTTTAPLTSASWPVVVTATNAVSSTTEDFTLTVNRLPRFVGAANSTAVEGVPFSYTVSTTGAVSPVVTESGALPPGITFTDDGGSATLSGTAAAGSKRRYHVVFTTTSGSLSRSRGFTVVVDTRPAITSPGDLSVTTQARINFKITTSGYPRPTVSEAGALPTGVSFHAGARGTATLSGRSTTVTGTWPLTLSATSAEGTTTQSFVLDVVGTARQ